MNILLNSLVYQYQILNQQFIIYKYLNLIGMKRQEIIFLDRTPHYLLLIYKFQ